MAYPGLAQPTGRSQTLKGLRCDRHAGHGFEANEQPNGPALEIGIRDACRVVTS